MRRTLTLFLILLAGCFAAPGFAAAPTATEAHTNGSGQITVAWTAVANATGYNLYYGTANGGPYPTLANGSTPINGTSYTLTGLNDTLTYHFVVTAIVGGVESGYSPSTGARSGTTQTAAPTGLAATGGNGQVSLSWTYVSGVYYDVYRQPVTPNNATYLLVSYLNLTRISSACRQPTKTKLSNVDIVIPKFTVKNASVFEVVKKLWEFGIPVCYEHNEKDTRGNISMDLFGTNCKEVLDKLVSQDPGYKYDVDPVYNVVDVYPKVGSVLDYKVSYYKVSDVKIISALADGDNQLGFNKHGIGLFWRGNVPDSVKNSVSFELRNQTARTCVNALVAKGENIVWVIDNLQIGTSVLVIGFLPTQL